jgi:lipopolysaccharide export LptBFGC system permease protein LptF
MEITAVVIGGPAIAYYLNAWGVSWWSLAMIVAMLALGLVSGNMLYDLWVAPANKPNSTK